MYSYTCQLSMKFVCIHTASHVYVYVHNIHVYVHACECACVCMCVHALIIANESSYSYYIVIDHAVSVKKTRPCM